jgi:hypothetical protein
MSVTDVTKTKSIALDTVSHPHSVGDEATSKLLSRDSVASIIKKENRLLPHHFETPKRWYIHRIGGKRGAPRRGGSAYIDLRVLILTTAAVFICALIPLLAYVLTHNWSRMGNAGIPQLFDCMYQFSPEPITQGFADYSRSCARGIE